jgi:hypothetical protein
VLIASLQMCESHSSLGSCTCVAKARVHPEFCDKRTFLSAFKRLQQKVRRCRLKCCERSSMPRAVKFVWNVSVARRHMLRRRTRPTSVRAGHPPQIRRLARTYRSYAWRSAGFRPAEKLIRFRPKRRASKEYAPGPNIPRAAIFNVAIMK